MVAECALGSFGRSCSCTFWRERAEEDGPRLLTLRKEGELRRSRVGDEGDLTCDFFRGYDDLSPVPAPTVSSDSLVDMEGLCVDWLSASRISWEIGDPCSFSMEGRRGALDSPSKDASKGSLGKAIGVTALRGDVGEVERRNEDEVLSIDGRGF